MAEVPDFSSYLSVYSCSNLTFVQLINPVGSYLPIGSYSEQILITDELSAATSCNFTFEIVDNAPPGIVVTTTHFPVYSEDPNYVIPNLTNYVSASENDECNDLVISQSPVAGTTVSSFGDYPIYFEASDGNGNVSSTVSFPLKLRHPGVITPVCQPDAVINNDPGQCTALYTYSLPSVPDRGVELIAGLPSGSNFPVGITSVEFEAETMIDTLIKFNWDDPLIRIGKPNIGPQASSWSSNAIYISNPTGGYAIQSPDSLDLIMPLEFLENIKGMELGFEYAAQSNRLTDAMNIGPHFEFDLDTNTYIKYKVITPFNNIITIDEPHIFDIPEDDQFHRYLFRYDNRTGIAQIFLDDNLMWSNDNPIPGSRLYFGNGSFFKIGSDCNGNGTKIDNLFINKYTTNETCSFNVTVVDVDPPTPDCPGDTTLYVTDELCESQLFFSVSGSDDCSGISNITQLTGLPSVSFFPLGSTTNTFEISDGYGNTSTCSFEVLVADTIDPIVNCIDPIILPIDSFTCGSYASFDFDISDNCGIVDTVHISGVESGDFIPLGIHSSTYAFLDASGNSVQCTFTVIVEDDMDPVIDCSDLIVYIDQDCAFTMPNLSNLVSDNCDSDPSIMQTPAPGTLIQYDAPVLPIISAMDAEGNQNQCAINVVLTDTIFPVIDCIVDTTIYSVPDLCGVIFDYPNGAEDNCPDLFFQQLEGLPSGSVFPIGVTEIKRLVQDIGANQDSCHFIVTVLDTIKPVLNCSPIVVFDFDNNCQEVVYYDLSSRATDACTIDYTNLLSGPPSGSVFPEGITEIEFMAMDMNGNTDTCTFEIEVIGGVNWTLQCLDDQVVTPDADCGYLVNNYTSMATIGGSCSRIITITQDPAPMTQAYGNTEITIIAEDDLGTVNTCTFTVMAEDFEAPQINCPSDTVIFLPEDQCEVIFNYEFLATDNCQLDSIEINGYLSGQYIPVGNHTIEGIAWDGAGASSSCSFNVIVLDSIAPVFSSCLDIEIVDDDGDCFVLADYAFEASDNCGIASINILNGPEPDELIPADSIYVVEYEAIDIYGNQDVCSFSIHAIGTGMWNFDTLDDQEQYVDENCEVQLEDFRPIAPIITTCATVELIQEPEPGTVISSNTVVTITGSNDLNTEDLIFTVVLEDTLSPEITCPTDTIIFTEENMCGAHFEYWIEAVDNCGMAEIEMLSGIASNDFFPVALNSITFQATDVSGNSNQCSFTVEVMDQAPPEINCDSVLEYCTTDVIIPQPIVTDDCEWENLVNSFNGSNDASGTYEIGNTSITWTVQDVFGNIASCNQEIIVFEEPSEADAGIDQELFFGNATQMNATTPNVGSGVWNVLLGGGNVNDPSDPHADITNLLIGENMFEWVISHENCEVKSDTVVIYSIDIAIPNAFSPDNDMRNDFFEIKGIQFFPENTLTIYNRWGAVVYEGLNYFNEWDGRDKSGNLLPMDTYYLILEIKELKQPYHGFVVIKY